ncbi:hypothetical protein VNI00_013440 [Paramarasmius palmivorus]|uniref:Uncharacterized protein n=1 Tax=Paramarasmius palmivorus TaxID=297713 RepID=A0AAW0C006_9AGAR
MSSLSLARLLEMAAVSDPHVIRHVHRLLLQSTPSSRDTHSAVQSRCASALEALEVYSLYLFPAVDGSRPTELLFPGSTVAGTWEVLWKWFVVLELWSPSVGGGLSCPDGMRTSLWYDRVLHAIFGLVFVLIEHHSCSPLSLLVLRSEPFIRLCLRSLFGCLSVEGSTLHPVSSVMIHPFWRLDCFEGVRSDHLFGLVLRDDGNTDFVEKAMHSFTRILYRGSVLENLADLYAVGIAVVQLYSMTFTRVLLRRATRCMTDCVRVLLQEMRQTASRGPAYRVALDTDGIGRMLSLCIRFLTRVSRRDGSGGWVLGSLRAGLLRAIVELGFFLRTERVRAAFVPVIAHETKLAWECGNLLTSLVPHLLTPAILRLSFAIIRKNRSVDTVLAGAWAEWAESVARVRGVYVEYGDSRYKRASRTSCGNSDCPHTEPPAEHEAVTEEPVGEDEPYVASDSSSRVGSKSPLLGGVLDLEGLADDAAGGEGSVSPTSCEGVQAGAQAGSDPVDSEETVMQVVV